MKTPKRFVLAFLGALVLTVGCSKDEDANNGNGNGDGGDGDGGLGNVGNPNAPDLEDIDPEAVCYNVEQGIGETTGRVMLLQDISSSMEEMVGGQTKWEIARAALVNMVTEFGNEVEFGLDFFPIDDNCGVGNSVAEDAAPNNGANLAAVLGATNTGRTTPLYEAMRNFLDASYAPAFMADGSDSYLVVVSDGMDSCSDIRTQDLAEVTSDLLAHGIRTFVIGFGSGVDPGELNAIAENGGTQFTTYFDAQDEQQLNEALDSIGQAVVVSCRYEMGTVSEDANREYTNIYFDGTPLTRGSECSGDADWTWGDDAMTTIQFCQDACALLENGVIDQLNVIVMCNEGDVVLI